MASLKLQITGMTCDHCARAAEQALNRLPGVRASVRYEAGVAHVEADDAVDIAALLAAVESRGYGARLLDGTDHESAGGVGGALSVAIVGSGSGAFAAAI